MVEGEGVSGEGEAVSVRGSRDQKYGVKRKESMIHKRRKHGIQQRIASHQKVRGNRSRWYSNVCTAREKLIEEPGLIQRHSCKIRSQVDDRSRLVCSPRVISHFLTRSVP